MKGFKRLASLSAGIHAVIAFALMSQPMEADAGANPSGAALDDVGVDLKSGNPNHVLGNAMLGPMSSPDLQLGVFATHYFISGKTPLYGTVNTQCTTYGGVSGCIYQRRDWNLNGETHSHLLTPPSQNVPFGFTEQGGMATGWTITTNDGTIWTFSNSQFNFLIQNYGMDALVSTITYPTGEVLTYSYTADGELRSIVSNRAYMLHLEGYKPHQGKAPNKVQLINLSRDYCAPLAATCSGLTLNWPAVTYVNSQVGGVTTIQATDNIGRTTTRQAETVVVEDTPGLDRMRAWFKYTTPGGVWLEWHRNITVYNLPGSNGITCTARSLLSDFSTGAGTWNYTWTGQDQCTFLGVTSGTSIGPDGITQRFDSTVAPGGIYDGLGRRTAVGTMSFNDFFGGGGLGLKSYEAAEGNKIEYFYDWRRNLTLTRATAKTGGATITSTSEYSATCSAATAKVCNKPTFTIDGNGNRTDYTYYPQHGGIDTALLPPDDDGVRPRVKYMYVQRSARYKDAGGSMQNGPLIWVVDTVSRCKTGATCAGTIEEVVTSYSYNDNLWPTTTTIKDGTGVILSAVTAEYDPVGNVISQDGPASGASDKIYSFFDDARQLVGEIGVDPDGTGPLLRPATRYSLDLDGRVTRVDAGNVAVATKGALDLMTPSSSVVSVYDSLGRKIRTSTLNGSVTQNVVQMSYDIRRHVICTATRMNPAVFGSLPQDACAPSTAGEFGPDRITKNVYDAAGQVVQVIQGLGTPDQRVYATYKYSDNGEVVDVIDSEGKRTHFEYDGFDRMVATRFPSTTKPAAFNPSTQATALATAGAYNNNDAEIYGYDANGNMTSLQRRDVSVIAMSYDKLNRLTLKDLPGGTAADVYIGYDLLSSVLYKRFASKTSGTGVTYVPDLLGRVNSATDMNGRTLGYSYNAGSVRTRLTLPDTNYIGYTLDDANRVTYAGWNANSGLFSQTYNNLGQLIAVGKGGSATNYEFTPTGRMTRLENNVAGTNDDVIWTFPGYNPEGEIVTKDSSNNQYEYRPLAADAISRTHDGLNRIDAFAALPNGYDARGNLRNDGVRSMTFDIENQLTSLTSASANLQLTYDPEGRLSKYTSNGTEISFLYDGFDLIGEYGSSGVLRRYVHGSLLDDPVVWLEGSNASDVRYLFANYQGSIIAYANSSGVRQNVYKYGPYGEPKNVSNAESWDIPRFGFTGQPTLAEAKLYYLRARVYDPGLGRFLQPDPLGTADDMNLYAYAGGDPINGRDPSGLSNCPQPDDPNCIETPESADEVGPPKPKSKITEELEEVVVTAHKQKKDTNGKKINFHFKERGFIVSTTDFLPVKVTPDGTVNCGPDGIVEKNKVQQPGQGEAGAHTHYNEMAAQEKGSVPWTGDHRMANASPTKTAFMMTSQQAFSIEAMGGTYRVTVISGPDLTPGQRAALIKAMQVWESPAANAPGATEKEKYCPKP